MDVNIGPVVKVLRVIGVAAAHDRGRDNGINFDARYARTSIGNGAKHIHASAGTDNCELAVRPENVGKRWRSGHQVAFPFRLMPLPHVRVHDVGGRVRIDNDCFGLSLPVHFDA